MNHDYGKPEVKGWEAKIDEIIGKAKAFEEKGDDMGIYILRLAVADLKLPDYNENLRVQLRNTLVYLENSARYKAISILRNKQAK